MGIRELAVGERPTMRLAKGDDHSDSPILSRRASLRSTSTRMSRQTATSIRIAAMSKPGLNHGCPGDRYRLHAIKSSP